MAAFPSLTQTASGSLYASHLAIQADSDLLLSQTVLQISRVHVYLTYPFVLSWSMLEAMSTGCPVVGPKTPPVEEVLRHRENGLLVDFFDVNAIAATVVDGLANPEDYRALRQRARRTIIDNFDLRSLALPAQLKLLREVTEPEGPYLWKRRDR